MHNNPKRGCLESHINCIKYAKGKGLKNIMILEDDATIVRDLSTLPPFPKKWDMIYFGVLATKIIDLGSGIRPWVRGQFMCNHAYIVNNSVYDEIIEEGWKFNNGSIDDYLCQKLHHKYNAYAQIEPYIIQDIGFSDLDKKNKKWHNFEWPNIGEEWSMPS